MGRSKGSLHAAHQAVYRERRKLELQPLRKPWDFMTSQEVKAMAWKAYRAAAWYLKPDLEESRFTHLELRSMFAESLAEMFKDALYAHTVSEGQCWPVDASTPPYRNYPRVWEMLCDDMPENWNPQYPVYQEVTPASARHTPEVVTNADEGNVNGINFKP
jgi:hypothetical protein